MTENRFKKLGKGYSAGAHDTVYASEDFTISPLGSDNEDLDLFADDDDLFN